LAVESDENEFNFYATKFYQNVNPLNTDLINSDVTFSNVENYSGIIHLIDKTENIVYTKKIDNGKIIQYAPFKTKKKSSTSLYAKEDAKCETVRVTYYTEWYKVYNDENGDTHIERTHIQETGYDFEEVCTSTGGFPEMDDYAPNGAGIFKKTGTQYTEEEDDELAFIDDEISNCPDGLFPNANGDCVADLYDQIDNTELTGKEKCIDELLKANGTDYIKNLLKNFEGESEFDIAIVSKDNVYSENLNAYVNGKTSPPINGTITISISSSKAKSFSALSVARTIFHEYIHADIFRKLETKYPTSGELDFRKTYEEYGSQHGTMAALYIISMRDALKSFYKKCFN
jgi:hypothetical protein